MSRSTKLFNSFVDFRQKLIQDIFDISVCHETRTVKGKTVIVRPVGVIKSKKKFHEFSRRIATWHKYTRLLCKLDPVRFIPTSTLFHPAPEIITDTQQFTYTTTTAVNSKLYDKAVITHKMELHIQAIRSKIDALEGVLRRYPAGAQHEPEYKADKEALRIQRGQLAIFKAELDAMLEDNEEHYRMRNASGTDTICIYHSDNEGKQVKKRVPMAGCLFFAPRGGLKARPNAPLTRSDSYEALGIKPISCSLSLYRGKFYRESEVLAAQRQHREHRDNGASQGE